MAVGKWLILLSSLLLTACGTPTKTTNNMEKDTHGFVKIVASYPHGSGYCRVVFTQIQKKGKARDFKETACKDVAYQGWQFIR